METNKKVVLIDDEPDILSTLKLFLEVEGFEVATAADGIDGLEKIRKKVPDLVVLDLMLPKLDGYKICRLLKFDKKYKKVPVVIITARAQDIDRKKALEVGADAYITKPFEPDTLLEKIKELLSA